MLFSGQASHTHIDDHDGLGVFEPKLRRHAAVAARLLDLVRMVHAAARSDFDSDGDGSGIE